MESGGMKCVKFLLFSFNLMFIIAGVILITTGILVQTEFNKFFEFFEGSAVNHFAIFLIIVGFILFTICFFGCCGAYKENYCMVITFSVLLSLVFLLEIAAAITAHVFSSKIDKLASDSLYNTISSYPNGKVMTEAWDHMQTDLSCCGASNYTDWGDNIHLDNSIPDSCCIAYKESCGHDVFLTGNFSNIFPTGCSKALLASSDTLVFICLGFSLGVALVQIVGVIVSCFLAAHIRRGYQQV